MYDYNIASEYNIEIFEKVCQKIESNVIDLKKDALLFDVDTSAIQNYYNHSIKIQVFCDIEVDAVWVESGIELPFLNDI